MQPYIESQQMVAMATSLSCRVSAISAFCWPTTQTPSTTNSLVTIVHTKPVIALLVPKLVTMTTSLSISRPHLPHDSWGHPSPLPKRHLDRFNCFCTDDHRVSLHFTMGRPFPHQKNITSHGGSGPHLIHGSMGQPESPTQTAC